MPLYDYWCKKCGWFEASRGLGDSTTRCPGCNATAERAPCSGVPAANTETVGFKTSKEIVRA